MKSLKKQIRYLIALDLVLISIVLILSSFFYLENRIYEMNYGEWPGDCGQFVIWEAAWYFENDISLTNLSLATNPFVLFTGPLTVKEELKKLGIESVFYNNISIQEIKQKLDEKKPVIVMVNTGSTAAVDAGLTHYLFVFDYKEQDGSLQGFYFTDSYYYLSNFSSYEDFVANRTNVYYFTVQDLEEKRHDVLAPGQFVGEIQNAMGMEKFAIVVGEAGQDRDVNKKMLNVFKLQHYAEKIAAFVGKIVMKISKKV